MAQLTDKQIELEMKKRYGKLGPAQMIEVIKEFKEETRDQDVAQGYLKAQVKLYDGILDKISAQKERDKISAAEKRMSMKEVKKRYHLALREYHLNPANAAAIKKEQDAKMGIQASEESSEENEEEDQADQTNGGEAVKNFAQSGGKLFMDGIGYSRLEIQETVQKHFGTFVEDSIEVVQDTNEDILGFIKESDFRTRIYGVPLETQLTMNPNDVVEDEVKDDNIQARAILFRIFSSDLIELTRENKTQISRMFGRTFSLSPNTKIKHLMEEACKFWGVEEKKYELWYED